MSVKGECEGSTTLAFSEINAPDIKSFRIMKTHRNQVAALPGSSNGCATRERSSEGKMGSQDGLLCTALPPNFSLSLLSVVTTAPTSTSFAAPQSQGRPLLGQICRVVHFLILMVR